jgi:hypothetical protein
MTAIHWVVLFAKKGWFSGRTGKGRIGWWLEGSRHVVGLVTVPQQDWHRILSDGDYNKPNSNRVIYSAVFRQNVRKLVGVSSKIERGIYSFHINRLLSLPSGWIFDFC